MFFKLFSVLVIWFFSAMSPTFAQVVPTTTTVTTQTPMATQQMSKAKHGPMNFMGQWMFVVYGGTRINVNGTNVSLPYSEETVTIYSGQINQDGSMYFSGVVDNEEGSSISIYYNPGVDKQYAQVFMYVPVMEFGTSDQYTQTECKVFLAPKGQDYMHGTMTAIRQSTNQSGNWVTKSLFTGQVDIHRPVPPTPVVGGKG